MSSEDGIIVRQSLQLTSATKSAENYFDPDHQLNSAMAQAAPAR
jgi:hypothetical protein